MLNCSRSEVENVYFPSEINRLLEEKGYGEYYVEYSSSSTELLTLINRKREVNYMSKMQHEQVEAFISNLLGFEVKIKKF